MVVSRLGTALIVLGLLAIAYGVLWQLGVAPGSRVTLPPPVALERAGPGAREVPVPGPSPAATPTPMPSVAAVAPTVEGRLSSTPVPPRLIAATPAAAGPRLLAADVADRAEATRASGYAVRLAIPAIKVDTVVKQGGIVPDANGNPEWETMPFVAVHYGDLTSMIGAPGNAVIAGHVVTLSEGNVFRFLYQLDIGDQIDVWDQRAREHDFAVVDLKLVPPSDTSVMDPTPDETLTLITCGGTFDPVKREFSDRLIVTAKPL
ncbi:MAG TPA: sortase [Chloroflexota bacterium]|nr:sortase [Chloroflexota bacterium]